MKDNNGGSLLESPKSGNNGCDGFVYGWFNDGSLYLSFGINGEIK